MGAIPIPANQVEILLRRQTPFTNGSRRFRKLLAEPQRLEVAAAFLVEVVLVVLPVAVALVADSQAADANFCTTHE